MTFTDVLRSHEAGEQLAFQHPSLRGVLVFSAEGELSYFDADGHEHRMPIWLSDFDRDDWLIVPNE